MVLLPLPFAVLCVQTVAMVMLICTSLVAIAMVVSWDLSLWLVIPFWLFYTIFEGVLFSSTLYKVSAEFSAGRYHSPTAFPRCTSTVSHACMRIRSCRHLHTISQRRLLPHSLQGHCAPGRLRHT